MSAQENFGHRLTDQAMDYIVNKACKPGELTKVISIMKILILASNPRGDLKLNEEIRDLKGVIERSRNQKQLEVEVGLAVRPGDLQELLLKHEPEIVHFCGHGTGEQGLVFQNEAGQEQLVSTDALSNLFELFSEKVSCILLNACYSEIQAHAMIQHINYVIGVSQEIRDDAAIAFATGFYRALGYGRSIELSYKFGCNQIQLLIPSSGNSVSRSVVSEEPRKLGVADVVAARKVIPEHLQPIIKNKANLTIIPGSDVSIPDDSIAPATQAEIQLNIDRAVEKEIALKQYREKVKEFLTDRILTYFENAQLDFLKEELGLSDEEAEKILEDEQAPIKQAQQYYNKMLSFLIIRGRYPFNEEIRHDLKKFQAEKNLTDEEVEQISKPIIEKAEVEYQGKKQRYQQEFKQVIEAGYPINEVARNSLKNLQQSLGLSNEDVASTEQPIIASKEAGSKSSVHKEQPLILNETTSEGSQELSDSEIEILTDLLLRSGRAEFSARRALCIKIGVETSILPFLIEPRDADFALQLISYLQNIDNTQALCKICKQLETVFRRGKYFSDLSDIKVKLNCN